MAKILIAAPDSDDSDRYIFTAGSQAATMEVQNLQKQQPGDWWRAPDLSNAYVEVEQLPDEDGNLDPLGLAAPLYSNMTKDGLWRIREANTRADLVANPERDSGLMTFWPAADLKKWPWVHGFKYFGANYSTGRLVYPFVRFDFIDPTNPDGWLQFGRLYMADPWEPEHDIRVGWGLKYQHNVPIEETQGGQMYPMPGPEKRRILRFNVQFSSEDDMMDNGFELDRLRGSNGDVLIIRDRASRHVHKHMIYGLISDLGEIVSERGAIFQKNYSVQEMPQ